MYRDGFLKCEDWLGWDFVGNEWYMRMSYEYQVCFCDAVIVVVLFFIISMRLYAYWEVFSLKRIRVATLESPGPPTFSLVVSKLGATSSLYIRLIYSV